MNELTRADVTAVTLFQATLPVPGQIIPDDPDFRRAINVGEQTFTRIGCTACHIAALPLDKRGWIYTEPSPYNPAGNLQPGEEPAVRVDLTSDDLPLPRLKPRTALFGFPHSLISSCTTLLPGLRILIVNRSI